MTTFEKIYWTSWVVSVVSWVVGSWLEYECWDSAFSDLLKRLIELNVVFTFGYLIVKLVLLIWGVHISLFPSIM
jgi:hypothetical protein